MSIRPASVSWLATALAVTAACSGEPTPPTAAAAEPAIADPAAPEAIARRTTFSPCAEDPELECGQLAVPVDYAHPRGPTLTLATVRARATGPRRGIVFVNPGGPGGSGVDFVIFAKELFAPLRAQFDVVSFDPRGTARSQRMDCTVALPPPPADPGLPAGAAFLDEVSARYLAACRAQHGDAVLQLGTDNVARDLDAFRAALGERDVNYVGFSYGTALGTAYATLFPERVRAMVLDGNVTPGWFSDYLVELDADGSAGAELALRRLDQRCAADPACPLASAGVVATFDRVVDRLNRAPVALGDGVLTGAAVAAALFGALYNEPLGWPAFVRVLALADAGNYTPFTPFASGPPSDTITFPSTFAIVCDDSGTRRPALDYLPTQTNNNAIYPRFGGVNFGLGTTACARWPERPVAPVRTLRTANPIVLIGNDYDPATPMAWTRNLAAALGPKAHLVRYQGGGHTVFTGDSACINDAILGYLADPSDAPTHLTCPAVPLVFAPPAARAAQAAPSLRANATDSVADILAHGRPRTPPVRRR